MTAPGSCTLSPAEPRAQRKRHRRARAAVERVESAPGEVRVTFRSARAAAAARDLVAAGRSCCPFRELELDGRRLRVSSPDRERWDVVEGFAGA